MNKLLFTAFIITLISSGCGNDNALKEKELELRERELDLKEKELQNQQQGNQTNYSGTETPQKQNNASTAPKKDAIAELYDKEKNSPKKYLDANYTYRVNLAANTIVEGKISNSAMVAGFKNVEITVYFYSKTDRVLGKESFTVMEFVPANGSVDFRHKISGWWDNVSYSNCTIDGAEAY